MRILVTGGLGFIGHHLTRALLARGDEVTILDARTPPVHDPSDPRPVPEGARLVEGDVTIAAHIDDALVGCEAVIHLAAYQDYLPDHHRFLNVNAGGTALLLERIVAARASVRRFVFASSQSVYGEGLVRCERDGVATALSRRELDLSHGRFDARCSICGGFAGAEAIPESFAGPVNAYGISKLAAEQVLAKLAPAHGIEAVALRYAIVHGAWQSPRNAYSGVLRAALVRALEGKPPIVFEDGRSLRDYVSVDDVVSATLLALDHPEAAGRAFNVAGSRSWTVLELLDAVGAATELDLRPEIPSLYRVGDVRHTVSATSGLASLGWTPTEDLAPTWRGYVAWLRGHRPPEGTVDAAIERMRALGTLRDVSISSR